MKSPVYRVAGIWYATGYRGILGLATRCGTTGLKLGQDTGFFIFDTRYADACHPRCVR